MKTLHEILWELRNEDLSVLLKLLDVKPERVNKATLIDTVKCEFEGDGLKRIWNSLSDLEKAAVSEAAYHPYLLYDRRRVSAKYGDSPPFYAPPENERYGFSSRDSKYATRLHLLLFTTKYDNHYFVPSDLAERLRTFVPQPEDARPGVSEKPPDEDGIEIRETTHEAVKDVMALLRLAENGELKISDKTAMPSAAGGRKISSCLAAGDFYAPEIAFLPEKSKWAQEIGWIKPVAWSRLLCNAGLIDVKGSKSKLTAKGLKALSSAPHDLLKTLWAKWIPTSRFDEYNRIEALKGQGGKGNPMTAKPPRRQAIIDALGDCPVGQWITTDNFSRYMRAADYYFEVARDDSRLYFLEHHYGNLGYNGGGGWNILQYRYILCFLFEYAATLGMVDIAYVHPEDALDDYGDYWGADELEWLSRYDGLRAFRLTELGAYCLGRTDNFTLSLPESTIVLEIGTQKVIRLKSGTLDAAERLLLESWAEPIDPQTWHLEASLARQAVERGQSAEAFAEFLR